MSFPPPLGLNITGASIDDHHFIAGHILHRQIGSGEAKITRVSRFPSMGNAQNFPKGHPWTIATFSTKVEFLDPARRESAVRNSLRQQGFIDLVNGGPRTKQHVAARFEDEGHVQWRSSLTKRLYVKISPAGMLNS